MRIRYAVPASHHRIVAARREPVSSLSELGDRAWQLLSALSQIDAGFDRFHAYDAVFAVKVCDTRERLAALLASSAIDWQGGRSERAPTHRLRLFNCRDGEQFADLMLTFGTINGEEVSPGVLVELRLGAFARHELMSRCLSHMAVAFQPDFAFLESPGMRPRASERPERPWIGWLTFVPESYGELPRLPAPCRKLPIAGGTVIEAAPAAFDAANRDHCDALEIVRGALGSWLARGGSPRAAAPPAASASADPTPELIQSPAHLASRTTSVGAPPPVISPLPFKSTGGSAPPPPPVAPLDEDGDSSRNETLDLRGIEERVATMPEPLPFRPAPPKPGFTPQTMVEAYARLSAELEVFPDRQEILTRHSLTEADLRSLAVRWSELFQREPQLLRDWLALKAAMMEQLRGHR
jgi:hypothetical protein